MNLEFKIEGGDFSKAGTASSSVKKTLQLLNIDFKIIKRIIVALYEAEVNVVAHANKGTMKVKIDEQRISVSIIDEGPGIADINKAMQEGFSTASDRVRQMGFGAGMGLPNIKRNTDYMNVESQVGVGTKLEFYNNLN